MANGMLNQDRNPKVKSPLFYIHWSRVVGKRNIALLIKLTTTPLDYIVKRYRSGRPRLNLIDKFWAICMGLEESHRNSVIRKLHCGISTNRLSCLCAEKCFRCLWGKRKLNSIVMFNWQVASMAWYTKDSSKIVMSQ